jgi:hypothetical protein
MDAESTIQLSTGLARLVRQLLSFFSLVLVEYGSRLLFSSSVVFVSISNQHPNGVFGDLRAKYTLRKYEQ